MELLNTNPALATLRLTLMMFVQYLSMGAALSTLGLVLGTHGMASTIAATFAVGGFVTIFSPVLIGMVADRFVPAQILLIGLNVVCALALLQLPSSVENHRAGLFLVFMGLFYSCFVPASAVANRIAFHSIGADKKRFTLVRTCGTLGFMAGALLVGQLGISSSVAAFGWPRPRHSWWPRSAFSAAYAARRQGHAAALSRIVRAGRIHPVQGFAVSHLHPVHGDPVHSYDGALVLFVAVPGGQGVSECGIAADDRAVLRACVHDVPGVSAGEARLQESAADRGGRLAGANDAVLLCVRASGDRSRHSRHRATWRGVGFLLRYR